MGWEGFSPVPLLLISPQPLTVILQGNSWNLENINKGFCKSLEVPLSAMRLFILIVEKHLCTFGKTDTELTVSDMNNFKSNFLKERKLILIQLLFQPLSSDGLNLPRDHIRSVNARHVSVDWSLLNNYLRKLFIKWNVKLETLQTSQKWKVNKNAAKTDEK